SSPRVAAAVAAFTDRVEIGDIVGLCDLTRLDQIRDQAISLGIDIGRNVMRDLARRPGQARALIVRRRTDPAGAALGVTLFAFPEPDMIPLPRIVTDRLFKGEVLLAAKHVQRTDGSLVVGT